MHYTNYVGGKFVDTKPAFSSFNPATEEELGQFPETLPEGVCEAVDVAAKAFKEWRQVSRIQRADYFWKLANLVKERIVELSQAISLETGKSLNESMAEVNEAMHMAQYTFSQGREAFGERVASEIALKDLQTFRKPKGVVAVISPWNFPFAIGGFWCAAPAILEGNTVVFKPSEETPLVGHLTAELYHQAGFPPGVFNLIYGFGGTGATLVNHSKVAHICFTGSAETGRRIRVKCAESWHKTCSCEMGSKSAVIVFDDANMDLAVNACVTSAYKLSGQRCVSAGRILVHWKIFYEFIDKFVEESEKVTIGDPMKGEFFMGPLINAKQLQRVVEYNKMTEDLDNVHVLLKGEKMDRKGHFMTPHVYTSEWCEHRFLREEVFGPHVAIIPFNDLDKAVDIYNDTIYGLSLAVCTNDFRKMREIRERCDYGLGYVNLPCIGAESHSVFGGVKASGNGSPSAAGTFRAVTNEVTWTVNYQDQGFQMAQGLK